MFQLTSFINYNWTSSISGWLAHHFIYNRKSQVGNTANRIPPLANMHCTFLSLSLSFLSVQREDSKNMRGLFQYYGMHPTAAGYMSVAAPATKRMQKQQELREIFTFKQEENILISEICFINPPYKMEVQKSSLTIRS
jgi:hypothetical protein